jgi:hypothetical protein
MTMVRIVCFWPKGDIVAAYQQGQSTRMNDVRTPRDKAWEAMERGDYETALTLYEKRAKKEPNELAWINNKASACFCLEQYEEARSALADAQRKLEQRASPYSERARLAIATWLCGDRSRAIEILRIETEAILRGKTKYLTISFGADEGAYLFYFGAAMKDQDTMESACDYLERLGRKRFFKGSWPPGLADYLFDKVTDAEIRDTLIKEPYGEEARPILLPRDLMKLDFWRAMKVHAHDGKRASRRLYSRIAETPNPLLLDEWYLARAEVNARSSPSAKGG